MTSVTAKIALGIFTSSSSVLAILQTVPVPSDTAIVGQVERLGLVGALIFAVVALWRELQAKNKRAESTHDATIAAFVGATSTMKDMKESMDSLKESVDKLITVRETMADVEHRRR